MFGWRRRSEGFEWREYVRTTVLVRRRDRQKRVDDALMAAVANVQQVKDRGVEAGRESLEAAGERAVEVAANAGGAIAHAAATAGSIIWNMASSGASALAGHFRIERPSNGEPESRTELRQREQARNERERKVREIRAEQERAVREKYEPKLAPYAPREIPLKTSHVLAAAATLAVIYFGVSILRDGALTADAPTSRNSGMATGSLSKTLTLEPTEIVGRASALSGDALRIEGTVLRLAGLEAPEASQPCFKANGRRWSCASSARTALDRIIRGRVVTCLPAGKDDAGHQLATCRAADTDVGAELVRRGHVFAVSGILAAYTGAEDEARAAAEGVWQGETVRPSEWRERAWEEAKRTAPGGCPIKATVRASQRTYAMPWMRGYDSAKPRAERGDRWFCSESEALQAGFVLAGGA